MTRTKALARRGPGRHEFRENQKTKEGREANKKNKQLKHLSQKVKRASKHDDSSAPIALEESNSSKPPEILAEDDEEAAKNQTPVLPTSSDEISWSATLNPSPVINGLGNAYDITPMNIISSSKIQKKATRSLELLSIYPANPPDKPAVVALHAKANVASKMISIAEIVKREIAEKGGKWFQYNEVGKLMEERKKKADNSDLEKKAAQGEDDNTKGAEKNEMDCENETFETMKTPFERAIEGQPKVRAVPTMTIYLSRVRIDSLRKAFSEQTNGPELPKG